MSVKIVFVCRLGKIKAQSQSLFHDIVSVLFSRSLYSIIGFNGNVYVIHHLEGFLLTQLLYF